MLVLSNSFEKHLEDLKAFARLRLFLPTLRLNIWNMLSFQPWLEKSRLSWRWKRRHRQNILPVLLLVPKCIPGFSEIARLLRTALPKKRAALGFERAEQEAFKTVKEKLLPQFYNKLTVRNLLCTDADGYAIGSVLLQGEKLEKRPLDCWQQWNGTILQSKEEFALFFGAYISFGPL